ARQAALPEQVADVGRNPAEARQEAAILGVEASPLVVGDGPDGPHGLPAQVKGNYERLNDRRRQAPDPGGVLLRGGRQQGSGGIERGTAGAVARQGAADADSPSARRRQPQEALFSAIALQNVNARRLPAAER